MEKILVVDDEPNICSGCRMILSEEGYEVATSHSGRTAGELLARQVFDVVLLDIRLPDISGIDLLKKIRKKKSPPHIIIMTGHGTVENAVDAMKNGAFDYLTKPFDDKDILKTVGMACDSRQLIRENLALKQQLYEKFSFDNIIGKNEQIFKIFNKIERVAPLDSTVLLDGESGTGKELFANAIHAHSKRAGHRFLAVDCNTFSSSLLESELFGHVKGAFTGATERRPGRFELASGGTLMLDEIGNLTIDLLGRQYRVVTHHALPCKAARMISSVDLPSTSRVRII